MNPHTISIGRAAAIALLATPIIAAAQGSLTPPPGVPGPVMKTLDQVEARTPLVAGQPGVSINANGTITISQPGSYYLTGNLTITTANAHGIVVSSNNVTLDLNGFSLNCTTVNGGSAVYLGESSYVRVCNGHIAGSTTWDGSAFTKLGWDNGIYNTGSPYSYGFVVNGVTVSGVRKYGIHITYNGSRAENCSVHVCGNTGIFATTVLNCVVRKAGGRGIYADSAPNSGSVENCHGEAVGAGSYEGIFCVSGCVANSRGYSESLQGILALTVINSAGTSTNSAGIFAIASAQNCHGLSNTGIGLQAVEASNCHGQSTSGTGLTADLANNCQGVSSSGTGLWTVNAMNCIGTSISGSAGLNASGVASYCQGKRTGGIAISCGIAVACTSGGGTISASNSKQLGTP